MSEQENIRLSFTQDWNNVDLDIEDKGMAYIYHIEDDTIPNLMIKIQSWDERKSHTLFNKWFAGRKIKVTIETLD